MQKIIALAFAVVLCFGISSAQNKTIDGIITNIADQPAIGVTVTVANSVLKESTITDENGYFIVEVAGAPVGIGEKEENTQALKVFPNPASSTAIVHIPRLEGMIEVHDNLGQLLDRAFLQSDQNLLLRGQGMVFLKYTNNEGDRQVSKLILQKENTRIQIEAIASYLKSGVNEDTHSYQLAVQGMFNRQDVDTVVQVTDFFRYLDKHTQDIQLNNNKPLTIEGKTFTIGKTADERFYDESDQEYLASRIEPNTTFTLISQDGTDVQEVSSDSEGDFQALIKDKELYFALTQPNNNTQPAILAIYTNNITNKENISAYSKEGSIWNLMQTQFGYANGNGAETLTPPNQEARTVNWDPALKLPGALNHVIMTKVWDDENREYVDSVTQEQIDTVLAVRNNLDNMLNDFYKNGNTVITDDIWAVQQNGRTHFHYYKNENSGGNFGIIEKNDLIIKANIGVNIANWDRSSTQYQENGSVEVVGELQNADKPSMYDAAKATDTPTDDDKRNLEWKLIRTNQLTNQGIPEKGTWAGDIHQLALEQGYNIPEVEEHITLYAPKETLDELKKYQTGEKSALKSGEDIYKITISIEDLEGNITKKLVDSSNWEAALDDKEIPSFYKTQIEDIFGNGSN